MFLLEPPPPPLGRGNDGERQSSARVLAVLSWSWINLFTADSYLRQPSDASCSMRDVVSIMTTTTTMRSVMIMMTTTVHTVMIMMTTTVHTVMIMMTTTMRSVVIMMTNKMTTMKKSTAWNDCALLLISLLSIASIAYVSSSSPKSSSLSSHVDWHLKIEILWLISQSAWL